jgi:ribulose-5-phosphate 4-epimerase/fuculose-1-phosphate aldolase
MLVCLETLTRAPSAFVFSVSLTHCGAVLHPHSPSCLCFSYSQELVELREQEQEQCSAVPSSLKT